jgi:hypothetical protein
LLDGIEDADNDGAVDITETDPNDPDTDDDDLLDGEEDANLDGVKDPDETDPLDPDTDEDGYPDGYEVTKGSDPLDPDSIPLDMFFSDGFETVPAALCGQCTTNDDCLEPTDQCLARDGGFYCGQDCSEGNPHGLLPYECPTGFTCEYIMPDGGLQCVPVTDSCTCGFLNEGDERPCSESNQYGTCEGIETCDALLGWVGCTAPIPSPGGCL